MSNLSVPRTLWYETDDRRLTLSQAELRRQGKPMVILGEPGMGKTHLLEWLADAPGYAFCSARKLINRHDPKTLLGDAKILVIDALDEVCTKNDGDAVDLVLRRLGELDYPRFVLSCRVADWRSATGMEALREQYEDEKPLELHLEPFNDQDAITFLEDRVGTEGARSVVDHFHLRGLGGFLGNPQTLELIADVAGGGPLPENRRELFERAVTVLRVETRNAKADDQLAPEAALDAAGAAFAALILTGNEAIVRKAEANNAEGEISITEICYLPGGALVDGVIGTRLFKANGADRFGYWHRRIGEYLGARWLAKLADTGRKRRRILGLFQSHGLVPASLRGMHAWLAQDPEFAAQVIAGDPMGVIEYGDADDLTSEQGRQLLTALHKLATSNPDFRGWGPYSLQGVVRPALVEDVRRLLIEQNTPFGLQVLILEALQTAPITGQLERELMALFLEQGGVFAVRRRAASALVSLNRPQDWQSLLSALLVPNDELTLRLAIEVMDEVGYEYFTDDLIVRLIISFAKCGSRTVGVLSGLEDRLPGSRIDNVLDHYAEAVKAINDSLDYQCKRELADFAYHLITRRVAIGGVLPVKLLTWLQSVDSDSGGDTETRKRLAQLLEDDAELRMGMLRLVLFDQTGESALGTRYWNLADHSAGFALRPSDIVALLGELDPSKLEDERWRDLVQLTRHDADHGAEVRAATYCFTAGRPEQIAWVDDLAKPRVYEWQIKQQEREHERQQQQAKQHAEQRQEFTGRLDAIRRGEYGSVVALAMAYLGMYSDIGSRDVPAHDRLQQWLNAEIQDAAFVGFESYLAIDPPRPTPDEIAESYAQGREWEAGYIVVAALAERFRKDLGFSGLNDERVLAGLFILRRTKIDDHAGIQGLEDAIEKEVRGRGLWAAAMRRYLEPQLLVRQSYLDGLRALMHDETGEQLAADLAAEWLVRFPDLPAEPEAELIDRLIRSGRHDDLRVLYSSKLGLDDRLRRLTWTAVGLLVDFDAIVQILIPSPVDPDLLWHVRDRTSGGYRNPPITLAVEQFEWIIASFRTLWPRTGYPRHMRHGDTNAWDAGDYLDTLIRRLGMNAVDSATAALRRLADAPPDGYTSMIRAVAAEQLRLRVELAYTPPTLTTVATIARDRAPSDIRDLQAFMLEELTIVQDKIKGDDTDSWRGFFDDTGVPYDEERCRDHLLGLLRQGTPGVTLEPEAHVASDKEVDITCSAGQLRLPIEIKGQWHVKLWQAADAQLDVLYAQDWRAGRCGIYLILWFGTKVPANKGLRRPGRGLPVPSTPEQLRDTLASTSQSVLAGRVSVVVLDLERK